MRAIAVFGPGDWSAQWVGPPAMPVEEQPGVLLRRELMLDRPVRRARLSATAHGIYEFEVNGGPVGDQVLAPGWTSYHHRLRVQTYDVTALIRPGLNAVGAHLADGWWRGRLGFGGQRALYGDRTAIAAQLEVDHDDGSRTVFVTDADWRWTRGPVVSADLYGGESYDTRRELPGWSSPGFDDSVWQRAAADPLEPSVLVAPLGPPVRRIETVRPTAVWTSPGGATLVDFGVNLVGWLRLSLPDAPAGTLVRLRHAEVLEHEELGVRPLRSAEATDTVILDGSGPRSWEPRFTIHGFRYAEVSGWPGDMSPDDLVAVVVHSDMRRLGTFTCSDPDLVTLHDNVVRSMRGNFVDLPTDCPQRDERLGWTGDIAVFAPTAAFLYDVTGLLRSWLRDVAVEQTADGIVPLFAPDPGITSPDFDMPVQVEAGWGDAIVVVPWALHLSSGDADLLREFWPRMQAWVSAFERRAGADLDFPDGGFMLGDWLDPAAPDDQPWAARVPWQLVATAYLARTASLVSRIGELLGEPEPTIARYANLFERTAARFRAAYVAPDGRLTVRAQTAYALALEFELLGDEEQVRLAGDDLAEQVAADGYHIGTGFLGTPYVCDALTRTGHVEDAYRLLLQRECPSWLYPVTMGATTVWERWNSMLPDGSINPGEMTSFNHYALGAVADWMHRTVAGLAPGAPGYHSLLVAPRPGGTLTSAAATHETPFGRAAVSWVRDADELTLDVVVPPGSTATVSLPDGSASRTVRSGEHRFTCRIPTPGAGPDLEVPS